MSPGHGRPLQALADFCPLGVTVLAAVGIFRLLPAISCLFAGTTAHAPKCAGP